MSNFGSTELKLEDVGQLRSHIGVQGSGKVPRLDDPVVVQAPEDQIRQAVNEASLFIKRMYLKQQVGEKNL